MTLKTVKRIFCEFSLPFMKQIAILEIFTFLIVLLKPKEKEIWYCKPLRRSIELALETKIHGTAFQGPAITDKVLLEGSPPHLLIELPAEFQLV